MNPPLPTRPTRRGHRLTKLGLGTAPIGNLFGPISDEEARITIDTAWDAGIRYFDTAPHYGLGLAERRLGNALSGRPRNEYLLSTKVGRLLIPRKHEPGELDDQRFAVPATHRRVFDFSRDGILRSLESSLNRLGTDRVDIVYLHDPDQHWETASTSGVRTLVELRDQGVVGLVGVGMNDAGILSNFIRHSDIDIVMLGGRYTLLDRRASAELLPLARERNVAVVAAGIYNSGLLAVDTPGDGATYDYAAPTRSVLRRLASVSRLCARYGATVPEAAVQFPLTDPAVVSAVIGARDAQQVKEATQRLAKPIDPRLWIELAQDHSAPH